MKQETSEVNVPLSFQFTEVYVLPERMKNSQVITETEK